MALYKHIFLNSLCLCPLVFLFNVFLRNIKIEPIGKKLPFHDGEISMFLEITSGPLSDFFFKSEKLKWNKSVIVKSDICGKL